MRGWKRNSWLMSEDKMGGAEIAYSTVLVWGQRGLLDMGKEGGRGRVREWTGTGTSRRNQKLSRVQDHLTHYLSTILRKHFSLFLTLSDNITRELFRSCCSFQIPFFSRFALLVSSRQVYQGISWGQLNNSMPISVLRVILVWCSSLC